MTSEITLADMLVCEYLYIISEIKLNMCAKCCNGLKLYENKSAKALINLLFEGARQALKI
jgi:hypothetical protein